MEIGVEFALDRLLETYHIKSIRELGRIADIRHAALSELASQKRKSISFEHIRKIAEALNITDINEIIKIHPTNNHKKS